MSCCPPSSLAYLASDGAGATGTKVEANGAEFYQARRTMRTMHAAGWACVLYPTHLQHGRARALTRLPSSLTH